MHHRLTVIKPAEILNFFLTLSMRSYVYVNDRHDEFYNRMSDANRKDVDELNARIFSDYGIEITADNQFNAKSKELVKLNRFYSRLVFTEKIVPYYLFKDVILSDRDIKDVFGAYVSEIGCSNDDEAARVFISGMLVKLLVKSVIRMKELLPKWVFISSAGFDKRSLDGVQTMCFCPNYMGHTLYYNLYDTGRICLNKSETQYWHYVNYAIQ